MSLTQYDKPRDNMALEIEICGQWQKSRRSRFLCPASLQLFVVLLLFIAPVTLEASQRICVKQIKQSSTRELRFWKNGLGRRIVGKNERQPGLQHGEGRKIVSKSFIDNNTDRSGRSDRQARVM